MTCATRRSNPAALNPAVKSLNYLNNVMARIEANLAGADEALMLNDAGNVAECTADNVFIIKRGQILRRPSPPAHCAALRARSCLRSRRNSASKLRRPTSPAMMFSSRTNASSRDGCGDHSSCQS